MRMLTLIKAGSTFPDLKQSAGDFEDWIIRASGLGAGDIAIIDAVAGEALPPLAGVSGIIITGSHAMITDRLPWMRAVSAWLVAALNQTIPVLGICFGHQLLADSLGGQVAYHPQGPEIGTVAINLTAAGEQDVLLGALPGQFMAHATHAQSVSKLPANALCLAGNAHEPHHAFRIGANAWGVQFHPEFSAAIMRVYLDAQSQTLLDHGVDVAALAAGIRATEAANGLIGRFVGIVRGDG